MAENRNELGASSNEPRERVDASREPARDDRDRRVATEFRQMSQAERVGDKRMNPAAKQVAAMDAAIEHKYGKSTPEAARMKLAAREAVAQTLERGGEVRAPRVRELDRQRDETREQEQPPANKASKGRER